MDQYTVEVNDLQKKDGERRRFDRAGEGRTKPGEKGLKRTDRERERERR